MTEETKMMRPVPRSAMCSNAGCAMKNDPDRFTARTVFQSSMDIFMAILSMVIPALLTRMSILPCSSRTSWTTRWQSSGRETLPWWTLARPGPSKSRANSLTNCSARSRLPLYPAATEAPWLARLLQTAAPIPRVPPVTSATRPASLSPITPVVGSITVELVFMRRLPGCCRSTPAGRRAQRVPPNDGGHGHTHGAVTYIAQIDWWLMGEVCLDSRALARALFPPRAPGLPRLVWVGAPAPARTCDRAQARETGDVGQQPHQGGRPLKGCGHAAIRCEPS